MLSKRKSFMEKKKKYKIYYIENEVRYRDNYAW